jgi:hypothetical protein
MNQQQKYKELSSVVVRKLKDIDHRIRNSQKMNELNQVQTINKANAKINRYYKVI